VELNDPLDCRIGLPGWRLYFAGLRLTEAFDPERLAGWLESAQAELRQRLAGADIAGVAEIDALRELFRAAGTNPSRYRPSSEALARRVLKGDSLPRIQPLVDFNNLLSLRTLLPCCVMAPEALAPPLAMRPGRAGETVQGLKTALDLEGKPVLEDTRGPFGTPITDDHRVILAPAHREALLVVYLPASRPTDAGQATRDAAAAVGGIRVGPEWIFG